MPESHDIPRWTATIRSRYESYLRTLFYFKDARLRASFRNTLQDGEGLLKGPFRELDQGFSYGATPRNMADAAFPQSSADLWPALIDKPLYAHQEEALQNVHFRGRNVVVATGTASGKTESFLYPILFSLYREHLAGKLERPGVRAMILYPMNALANDQRDRLGAICAALERGKSQFRFTFGQYTGQTPENSRDRYRNATLRAEERLPGEMVFREDMRQRPPHILLTNYSMLEYLLIRPQDSSLFDGGRGRHWRFVVLDEAHQYRGARGMEMGMLLRRLKERVRDGGRSDGFQCIATSATISTKQGSKEKLHVADFASELFGERFDDSDIVFGSRVASEHDTARRHHVFVRALEGAFLVHEQGEDKVVLNRTTGAGSDNGSTPLEIALCRECGQHYYVGRVVSGGLREAVRDPSHTDFGVEFFLPSSRGDQLLCRKCGRVGATGTPPTCDCDALVQVLYCPSRPGQADQLAKCGSCEYRRGGVGDPVQEVVHGHDGPNTVIATTVHELLAARSRKILTFADSRQEAAFFAWYLEDTYDKIRDRNLMWRAVERMGAVAEVLSLSDLADGMSRLWEEHGLFRASDTVLARRRQILGAILAEAVTSERRLSLEGVGLVKWYTELPDDVEMPRALSKGPWGLDEEEGRRLVLRLVDEFRRNRAVELAEGYPVWGSVSPWAQQAFGQGPPRGRRNVAEWGSAGSGIVRHFLTRVWLGRPGAAESGASTAGVELMKQLWRALRARDRRVSSSERFLVPARGAGTFRVSPEWLRIARVKDGGLWECGTCGMVSPTNIRGVCARHACPGHLRSIAPGHLEQNHYRQLYANPNMPSRLQSEEHTAQIDSEEARRRQNSFKRGDIHVLSSSTTFEVGGDLGDLDVVFLRNVPPEAFNYTQRVGRAGRRDSPGMAVTYCRRNPHDLYHYESPEQRIIKGEVKPPRLRMSNEKIIRRHMTAVALSAFFRDRPNADRFSRVERFVEDWLKPSGASSFWEFCTQNRSLEATLRRVVPTDVHEAVGLADGTWMEEVSGPKSRLAEMEAEVCGDYCTLNEAKKGLIAEQPNSSWTRRVARIEQRMRGISSERTLNFLSRKAVIPKYGFPVDVVELDTHGEEGVSLARDLSQAIAEYAPGSSVVAKKLEWKCAGLKVVPGCQLPVRRYQYDDARNFRQEESIGTVFADSLERAYVSPIFGFVTPLVERPQEPRGRSRRLYTTRPFFQGVGKESGTIARMVAGVRVTKAQPGTLVILCEGKGRAGFHICLTCGGGFKERTAPHKSPHGSSCNGTLEQLSLGHELVTDVVRLQFPGLIGEWDAYSVAYAVVLGVAKALDVPDTDLNVTITAGERPTETGIVLYDNVPGGAGLVAQLEDESLFREALERACERVEGGCGCDTSCYGCLRSYRNQFAHTHLDRKTARSFLADVAATA